MYKTSYDSPLGLIYMASDGEALTGLWFAGSRDEAKHGADETYEEGAGQAQAGLAQIFAETRRWLDIYFSGRDPGFAPPYKLNGLTPFRREVVEIMKAIPFGETVTYNEIAKEIASRLCLSRMSAQAVGGAVGWNPVCLIIPCHRVVGANGSLTGYGGGIDKKIGLLRLEGHDMSKFTVPKRGGAL